MTQDVQAVQEWVRKESQVIEKLMGLLVTVIAVQLMIDGITPVIRSLMG